MYLSKISFHPTRRGKREFQDVAARVYLQELQKSGQVCGDPLSAWCDDILFFYTYLSKPDAIQERYGTQSVRLAFQDVVKQFGQPPTWEMLETAIPERFPRWTNSESLFLFTHAYDISSPVCNGKNSQPIPVYLLGLKEFALEKLAIWSKSYRSHDYLYFNSGDLEIPAYKQMADPRSELSRSGREICSAIEAVTNKPTYYYLHRYWGRKEGESSRVCPSCGSRWHSPSPLTGTISEQYPFRCDRCRLISRNALAFDDERHARIGEFPKQA
jgi:predicted  nucleic acid-binding Zn ribbon protein